MYGAADAVMGCGLGFGQHDPEDEALFNASGLCEGQEYTSLVLLRNFSFTKGEVANCSEIVVGGFSSSPACGVDPPNAGSMGTYFLCTAMVQSGLCSCDVFENHSKSNRSGITGFFQTILASLP